MSERNPGKHDERSIAPRLRVGEKPLKPKEGMVVTRLYGDLVHVPARAEGEPYVGNSPYTEPQARALAEMARDKIKGKQVPQAGDIYNG